MSMLVPGLTLSCAFPPVPQTPAHVELAESLGFHTAWIYDTPALQLDCWMTLALAAARTTRIRLGPGVAIPSLRHPMVTASAIAHLVELAGAERVVMGVGTGFTGRRAMGRKPLRWSDMPGHIDVVQALLRGETVTVEGQAVQMLHWPGQAPARPIEVPWVVAVNGPRGLDTARRLACGVFTSRPRPGADYHGLASVTLLGFGTVLEPGESLDSPRVLAAAGPGASVAYHAFLEQGDERLSWLPNSDRFVELAGEVPEAERHLAIHRGHLTELNDIDRQVLVGESLRILPLVATAAELPERIGELAAAGITEIAFQPMGDIERELRAFAAAAGLTKQA
ncbi:MAG: LLM class flavin-dependent oxidoreductase [Acidimicrobiales bacterium]